MRQYRAARTLPLELAQHVQIYFEEELYTQSLTLLISLITSSTTHPDPSKSPAITPPPSYLSLAATLSLHPLTTTRTKSSASDRHEASLLALKLLKLTLRIVGPVNGQFAQAFQFKHFEGGLTRHGRGEREITGIRLPSYPNSDGTAQDFEAQLERAYGDGDPASGLLKNEFSDSGSLFVRAEDFWTCVGWSFNCSVLCFRQKPGNIYEKRWERWCAWLEFMLDLMEEDWRIREIKPEPGSNTATDSRLVEDELKNSLIYRYIIEAAGSHGRDRRIMRAIFADGTPKSTNEFKEIFKNELKGPKEESKSQGKPQPTQSHPRVNIEEGIYGDYLEASTADEDSDSSQPTTNTRPKRRQPPSAHDPSSEASPDPSLLTPTGITLFGSHSSLTLRLRLMSLLLTVSVTLGNHAESSNWTPTTILSPTSLNDLFTEFSKFLPLPIFSTLLSPTFTLPYFELNYYTTLCENLLFRLLEPCAPETEKLYLTQRKLETCFLPFAANGTSAEVNAKVSLVLEGLLRAMVTGEKQKGEYLKWRESLEKAVEQGIERRETKVKKKDKGDGDDAWVILVESGQRMRDVVRRLKNET